MVLSTRGSHGLILYGCLALHFAAGHGHGTEGGKGRPSPVGSLNSCREARGRKAPASGASLEQAWIRTRCRAIVAAERVGAGLGR
jgi:hypothetical protein